MRLYVLESFHMECSFGSDKALLYILNVIKFAPIFAQIQTESYTLLRRPTHVLSFETLANTKNIVTIAGCLLCICSQLKINDFNIYLADLWLLAG